MRRRAGLIAALMGVWGVAAAQTPATVSFDLHVLPAIGDPATVKPLATRTSAVSPTSPLCNQPAQPACPVPCINPASWTVDDPFVVPLGSRSCRLPLPVGLPNGTGYRVVAQARAADGTLSLRSPVGTPVFQQVTDPGVACGTDKRGRQTITTTTYTLRAERFRDTITICREPIQ